MKKQEFEQLLTEVAEWKTVEQVTEIVRLKKVENCEDCGRGCEGGRKIEHKFCKTGNKTYWRRHCLSCDKYENPNDRKFNMSGTEASNAWITALKGNNKYKSKWKSLREECCSFVDDNIVIRKYPETNEPL